MAATDLERLVVQLSADIKGYENSLKRAQGVTTKSFSAIQKKAESSNKAIAAAFARTGVQIGAAFLTSAAVKGLAELSDSATRITNALKVAGLSGDELEKVYQRLNKAALANGAPIETLATLYGKAAQAQKELGVSTEDLLGFTNNVALALRVAGTDAVAAQGALLQLGQALGSGTVHAEEFNSVLEGAPTIAQAAAAGLKEAGGSVAKLKQLVVDGKVSSEAFFRAFEAGAPTLQEKVAGSVFTLDQASTNLWTALTNVTKEFNDSTGASQNFAGGINTAASAINGFDVSGLIQKIRDAKSELDGFLGDLGNADIFKDLNQALGVTDGDGKVINLDATKAKDETSSLETEVKTLQERIALNTKLGFDNTEALARLSEVQAKLAQVKASAANLPATVSPAGLLAPTKSREKFGPFQQFGPFKPADVKPVSIDDFKPPSGTKTKKARLDGYQREVQQIKERTAALQAETAAQAGVNPLINDYGFAVELAAAKQQLLSEAQQAGVEITPALKASIDQLAAGYANAVVASEQLAEKQDEIRQRAEDAMATAKDVTRGIIDGFVEGASAADILTDSLKKIGDALLDDVLSSIFTVKNASGGGGFLGSIFGSLFGGGQLGIAKAGGIGMYANGTNSAPGGLAIVGERGPELVNLPRGSQVIPNLPSMKALKAGNSSPSITYAPVIDARGADSAAVARLEQVMAKQQAEFSAKVIDTVKNGQRRRIL